jgi:hypothetical protein
MRCRICGRECPPGSKICRDCASARKRAFAATVTLPLLAAVGAPSMGEPRFVPKPARQRAANETVAVRAQAPAEPPASPPAALPLNVVPRKPGAIWLLVAVIAGALLLLIVLRTIESVPRSDEPAAPTDSRAAPVLAVPSLPAQAEIVPALPLAEAAAKVVTGKPKRKPPSHVDNSTPAVTPPPSAPESVPVARAPVPPARVVETPRPDPWQALNEGLSGCARQGLLDRMACEERLRAQYCGNSWGVVPQCPIGTATDHGQ